MFVRIKERKNGSKAVQIVESHRTGQKVHQTIVRHVGQGMTDKEVAALKSLAESLIVQFESQRQPSLPFVDPSSVYGKKEKQVESEDLVKVSNLREEQRVIDGIGEVFGKLYDDLRFNRLIRGTRKNAQWNRILKDCVMARLANPCSKRRTASMLEEDYGIKIPLDRIYRMMDVVAAQESEIKNKIGKSTLSLFQEKVDVLFFDVTTLYFESQVEDLLKRFGYGKDGNINEVQVLLALVTTREGLPLTYEIFPGNMYEGHTLVNMLSEIKKRYEVCDVIFVADRAMFNEENLSTMESEEVGAKYVVAAKLKSLSKNEKEKILDEKNYRIIEREGEIQWVSEIERKGRRVIVSYSKKRAQKDAADRQRMIERLLKKAKSGKVKLSKITNRGTARYLKMSGEEVEINEKKIIEEARWDGIHGVITNIRDEAPEQILGRYHGLWQIEETFRVSKHDLKMRPMFCWTEPRIRAHIAICFLALAVSKQAVYRIKIQKQPMSFEQLRNELLHVQTSIVSDISTGKRYLIPSHATLNQEKIYHCFGLKRSEVPKEIIIRQRHQSE